MWALGMSTGACDESVWPPGCGHCKRMKPAYAEAAARLAKSGQAGVLATVDATVQRGLQDR